MVCAPGGASDVLWLRSEAEVAAKVDAVIKAIKDPLGRSDWDKTVSRLRLMLGCGW